MIDPRQPNYQSTPVSPDRPSFGYAPADLSVPPLVTLVTPFYNVGEVFFETAECMVRQSLQQWEWLIINDASTAPAALDVIEKIAAWNDPRVRLLHQRENQGPSAARNRGFDEARSPYVFALDADDLIEPTTLEKCLWFLTSYQEYSFVNGYSVGFGAQEYLWNFGYHNREAFLDQNLVSGRTMLRVRTHQEVGGYDPSLRSGMEDWDLWLRMANSGHWGATIPEYLDWYRRRENHSLSWECWDQGERQKNLHRQLRERYPRLHRDGWPKIHPGWHMPYETPSRDIPGGNLLHKQRRRLLVVVPWFAMGGSDKFTLDMLGQLTGAGWEVTLVSTKRGDTSWLPEFGRFTPDVFVLHNFLKLSDFPRFLQYLIGSRRPDAVMLMHSELGYQLLPFLRAVCPEPAYVDYCHIEENYWKNGGYARYAAGSQPMLELNLVTSEHLKNWLVERGASAERVEVCYINVDPEKWKPDRQVRAAVREKYHIPDDAIVILFAGRIMSQKQPRILAQTLLALDKAHLAFHALIAGDGPDKAWLDSFLAQNNLAGRVRMAGAVSSDAVREMMSASDIFFLPSQWEGIALSIFEAMSMELAVIGADVGGQRELLTADCGFLHPRGDEAAEVRQYAESLSALIADPQLRRTLGENARRRIVERFSLSQMGICIQRLLDRAIELRRTAPRAPIAAEIGWEFAARAVEFTRIDELCDQLWNRVHEPSRTAAPAKGEPAQVTNQLQRSVEQELAIAENSPAWRFYVRMQRSWFGKCCVKLRLAEPWNPGVNEPPDQRLARITQTRYFRNVLYLRTTRLYRNGQAMCKMLGLTPTRRAQE